VDDTDEVHHGLVGRSDGLLTVGPCGDGLANHFRSGKALAASQSRDALARFGVKPESEWRSHGRPRLQLKCNTFCNTGQKWDLVSGGIERGGADSKESGGVERIKGVGGIETVW
jgi:hypothetical protein